MATLDELYGLLIEPYRVEPHEHLKPRTWLKVDHGGAQRLARYLENAVGDSYLASLFADEYNTLWLVDKDGELRIAIEEVVLTTAPFVSAPMPNDLPRPKSKLGHPSLVEGGAARIGGELSIHRPSGVIYLTNKSGRYGTMRSEQELDNVVDLFARLGIDTVASYESPVL